MAPLEWTTRVSAPPAQAWAMLADLAHWPAWARHVRRIDGPSPVRPDAPATMILRGGLRLRLRVTAWEDARAWQWTGRLLWLTLRYDHRVDPLADHECRVGFRLALDGRGAWALGVPARVAYGALARRALRAFRRLCEVPVPE